MSVSNSKLLEFFARIPKLESDGSNWVIFKDRFLFAAAAASLKAHIDGTGKPPVAVSVVPTESEPPTELEPLTAEQAQVRSEYDVALSKWEMEEAIIKQALASVIPDSLFIEVRRKETALAMWNAVRDQREKKSRMVTVDMRRKLQSEKCNKHGDVRAHLIKLQTMREDLASMGGAISDEDFTSIILGSIPLSFDTYIAAITATSTLLNQTLSPTNLIDAIRDEADRRTIKNPKPKKEGEDAAFVAGQSSDKGKKGEKKAKKGKCYNCKNVGHFAKDCWAPGGGSEGKGPKQKEKGDKGKGKEVAAKVEEKKDEDTDGVWMATVDDEDGIRKWIDECGGDNGSNYEMWTEDEISTESDIWVDDVRQVDTIYSPDTMISDVDDIFTDLDGFDDFSVTDNEESDSVPDLESVPDSTVDGEDDMEVDVGSESLEDDLAIDDGEEPKTYTFAAI